MATPSEKPVNADRKRHVAASRLTVSPCGFPFFFIFPTVAAITIAIIIIIISATRRNENPECVAVLAPRVVLRAYNRKRSLDFTCFRRCHVVCALT